MSLKTLIGMQLLLVKVDNQLRTIPDCSEKEFKDCLKSQDYDLLPALKNFVAVQTGGKKSTLKIFWRKFYINASIQLSEAIQLEREKTC